MPPARVRCGGRAEELELKLGKRRRAPAQVGPRSQDAQARAWRVDQGPVEAAQIGWQLTAVGVDDAHVRCAEPPDVLLELTCPGLVHLDGHDLAREHRCLPAGRGAEIEHSLSLLRADAEPCQLRAPALRPDPALGERLLVDAVDHVGVWNVRFGPVRGLSPDVSDNDGWRLVLGPHQSERAFLPEIAAPYVPDPVRVGVLERPLRQFRQQRLDSLGDTP